MLAIFKILYAREFIYTAWIGVVQTVFIVPFKAECKQAHYKAINKITALSWHGWMCDIDLAFHLL